MSAKTNVAALPMDDPDLNDREANFETMRLIVNNQELIKARLDGLSEAIAVAIAKIDAYNAAPRAAATGAVAAPNGGTLGGKVQRVGIVSVYEVKAGKPPNQFDKTVARLANGKQEDISKKAADVQWFKDHAGQEVDVLFVENAKGYTTLFPA